MSDILQKLTHELRHHIPFTLFGAITGIVLMIIIIFGGFLSAVQPVSSNIFYILHPTHIFLSAIATTGLYIKYKKKSLIPAIIIGYTGSIGITTLSDSIIPYIGEILLDLPNAGIHIGFIEQPLLTNPPAFIGILVGLYMTKTQIPHAGHVLISTWASLFHVIMAIGLSVDYIQIIIILIFLFLAVWVPCCTSDIVYPMLFSKERKQIK